MNIDSIIQRFRSNLDEYSQGAAVLEILALIESAENLMRVLNVGLSSNSGAVLERNAYGNKNDCSCRTASIGDKRFDDSNGVRTVYGRIGL